MTDIADEFKIVVVEAIRSLCLKFPQKYRALMNFLSGVLREDGGFEYKKAIVDSILILIREIPDAKESGLAHLCEFIEVSASQATCSHAVHRLNTKHVVQCDPRQLCTYQCLQAICCISQGCVRRESIMLQLIKQMCQTKQKCTVCFGLRCSNCLNY